jgi:hypothetical protein
MGRIAFYTFGILRAQRGHEQVQGFFDRLGAAFEAAANTRGHLATYHPRSSGIDPTAFGPRFFVPGVHPFAPQTLSLWADLASVHAFAYSGPHAEALRLRRDWFLPPKWPSYAIWWVADDEIPSWTGAPQRLEHLHDNGPTPYAFNFSTPFDQNGRTIQATAARRAV